MNVCIVGISRILNLISFRAQNVPSVLLVSAIKADPKVPQVNPFSYLDNNLPNEADKRREGNPKTLLSS